ncbi:MAG: ABC transporter substrate-binding protein [Anaerolineales bacterium]|jgi:ABC-type transport system substrate-binding protein
MSFKKFSLVFGLLFALALVLAACAPAETPTPETVVETVVVTEVVEGEQVEVVKTVVVTVEPEEEMEEEEAAGGECCDTYRIGLFSDPVTLNYWNYLGPGSSVWTQYVLSGQAPSLFTLSDQRFDFVTFLAKDLVEPVDNGDGTFSMTVEMVEDAVWSDGEPITAHDVVFTHNACRDLKLTQNWPNQCSPNGLDITAEALDDFTVEYTFPESPSLGTWNAGIALAPILPEHFWADKAAEAYGFIEGLEEPTVEAPEGVDCAAEELSEEDAAACEDYNAAWDPYNEAFVNARRTLYEADATGAPVGGGYATDQWEQGAFVQRSENADYYFKGAEIVEYDDGTWVLNHPNGTTWQLYGDAAGDETLRFTSGPYAPNVIFSIYGSQDAAFLALANGEVDYVLNPLGLARGLQEQAEKGEGIVSYVNADYGMYYLAFNMRKYPMELPEFREAFDIVIDKDFVVNSVLGGVVFPMYSTMPPGNGFWHNPAVQENNPTIGLSREERVNQAVQVLKDGGWSWSQEPAWSEDLQDVVPGEGITMPNGEPMPALTILGPGPAYDPLRATFNQWISEWARELGMPVESELTGFNTILGPVFVDADFDLYILGWSLGNVAFPSYFFDFWHSSQDTAVSGNSNTPGLNSPEYDALVEEFMSTADLGRAQELVFQMQELLANLRPYIPLFYKQTIDLARDNIIFPYTESLGGVEFQAGFQTDVQPVYR